MISDLDLFSSSCYTTTFFYYALLHHHERDPPLLYKTDVISNNKEFGAHVDDCYSSGLRAVTFLLIYRVAFSAQVSRRLVRLRRKSCCV